jgi:putative transcriptional regulator
MDALIDHIRKRMLENGWNQTDLARAAKISRQTVSTLLNRIQAPTPDTLQKIANALNEPVENLYRLEGLLPPESKRKIAEQVLGYKLSELNEEEIEQVIDYVEYLYNKKERKPRDKVTKRKPTGKSTRANREGDPPPVNFKRMR